MPSWLSAAGRYRASNSEYVSTCTLSASYQSRWTVQQRHLGGVQGDACLLRDAPVQGEEEVQVPEPSADRIAQLTDMGFSDALARNALLLQRGNVEAALEWLLEHADDPAAAEPIPQERLRQVCGHTCCSASCYRKPTARMQSVTVVWC
jgi:hypothetical protein